MSFSKPVAYLSENRMDIDSQIAWQVVREEQTGLGRHGSCYQGLVSLFHLRWRAFNYSLFLFSFFLCHLCSLSITFSFAEYCLTLILDFRTRQKICGLTRTWKAATTHLISPNRTIWVSSTASLPKRRCNLTAVR